MYPDDRGVFTEVFREEWDTGVRPIQWNVVRSEAGVLRGVHVHIRHSDYLILIAGRAQIRLNDLREGSPTWRQAALVELDGNRLQALTIPRGVAHGFYFIEPSTHLYCVTHYFDTADELGCHWADPALQIPWKAMNPRLSERDHSAQPFSALVDQLAPWQPLGGPFPETADRRSGS